MDACSDYSRSTASQVSETVETTRQKRNPEIDERCSQQSQTNADRHTDCAIRNDISETCNIGSLEKAAFSSNGMHFSTSTPNNSAQAQTTVSWRVDDSEHPRNWPRNRKWLAVVVVSLFAFISPVTSSVVAPALPQMSHELHSQSVVEAQMMLSIFLLAFAIGPLFLGPMSEIYGRVPVLQLTNGFFLIFNLVCGFAQNVGQMLAFRFLSGLGGSASLTIGGGIIADCFAAEDRSKAVAVYSIAPMIGPAVGPIVGGFIIENTTWRWIFWVTSIADATVFVFGLGFLRETWAPKLLERRVKRLKQQTGDNYICAETNARDHRFVLESMGRAFRFLFTEPIVFALATYMAYLFGLVYLLISSFGPLFVSPEFYGESVGVAGLNYIALAIGFFLGSQLSARLNTRLYALLKQKYGSGRPEFRALIMVPCAVLLPVGLFWYGWSAQYRTHWIIPNVGACVAAAGMICGYQAIQTYTIDAYTKYAASALAAVTCLRNIGGFAFPLFAPEMYNKLGYGWGNSVLGFVAIALGVPAPWFFWHYGETMRKKSKFATVDE